MKSATVDRQPINFQLRRFGTMGGLSPGETMGGVSPCVSRSVRLV
jgi:hypothetical protein